MVWDKGNPSAWPYTWAFLEVEYRAISGTVISSAEFAPMTALNWAMIPHAKTEVEARWDSSTSLSADTPPLAVVAQHTMPRPVKGTTTDLTLNK